MKLGDYLIAIAGTRYVVAAAAAASDIGQSGSNPGKGFAVASELSPTASDHRNGQ